MNTVNEITEIPLTRQFTSATIPISNHEHKMNSPSHMSLALAVLGRKSRASLNGAIIWGSLTPDLPMYVLYAYEKIIGTPDKIIFNEKYYGELWQSVVSLGNSIPIFVIIALFAYIKGYRGLLFFALAALLHVALDFPLHREDTHMHFYPLSDYKFISPVSYYETQHYGHFWSPIELILIIVSTYIGLKALITRWGQLTFGVVMAGATLLQVTMIYYQWTQAGFE